MFLWLLYVRTNHITMYRGCSTHRDLTSLANSEYPTSDISILSARGYDLDQGTTEDEESKVVQSTTQVILQHLDFHPCEREKDEQR